jgi:hypothetical protein
MKKRTKRVKARSKTVSKRKPVAKRKVVIKKAKVVKGKAKRGRPVGSKNRPKVVSVDVELPVVETVDIVVRDDSVEVVAPVTSPAVLTALDSAELPTLNADGTKTDTEPA